MVVAGDTLYAVGGATVAGHSNSTASVTGLSLTMTTDQGSSSSSTSSSSPTTSNPENPLAVCPKERSRPALGLPDHGAAARANDGLDIRYSVNFELSENQNPRHQHLHVFTVEPDTFGGIDPAAETIQADAGNDQGSWVSLLPS